MSSDLGEPTESQDDSGQGSNTDSHGSGALEDLDKDNFESGNREPPDDSSVAPAGPPIAIYPPGSDPGGSADEALLVSLEASLKTLDLSGSQALSAGLGRPDREPGELYGLEAD